MIPDANDGSPGYRIAINGLAPEANLLTLLRAGVATGQRMTGPPKRRPGTGMRFLRDRFPALLTVMIMHGALLGACFLVPHGIPRDPAQPAPLLVAILSEPHPEVAELELPRPEIEPVEAAIRVPLSLVSIADAGPITGATPMESNSAEAVPAVANPSGAAPSSMSPITAPRFDAAYLHNPSPEYPDVTRRMHEQGTVVLRVLVSREGEAVRVLIDQSSGYQRLDDSAAEAVQRWRFLPARCGTDSIEAWVLVPVEFKLRHG